MYKYIDAQNKLYKEIAYSKIALFNPDTRIVLNLSCTPNVVEKGALLAFGENVDIKTEMKADGKVKVVDLVVKK